MGSVRYTLLGNLLEASNGFGRNNLIGALDLGPKIEVLRDLLDALAYHRRLDDILCAHRFPRHDRCACLGAAAKRTVR